MSKRKPVAPWRDRAIAATQGTQFGAILACVLDPKRDTAPACPRFVGRAIVTSDGYVMCNFVDRDGRGHLGAFVGAASDLDSNVAGLSRHLALTDADRKELESFVKGWIATDYRSPGR